MPPLDIFFRKIINNCSIIRCPNSVAEIMRTILLIALAVLMSGHVGSAPVHKTTFKIAVLDADKALIIFTCLMADNYICEAKDEDFRKMEADAHRACVTWGYKTFKFSKYVSNEHTNKDYIEAHYKCM